MNITGHPRILSGKTGNALVLVIIVMAIVFIFASVSLNTSNYGMLATNSSVMNINGYNLAEGGVLNAGNYLNSVFYKNIYPISEAAYVKIKRNLTETGETGILFSEAFAGFIDAEVRNIIVSDYIYTFSLNDKYKTEYKITVRINYSNNGFDASSTAVNLVTGVADTAAGRIEFNSSGVAETLITDDTGTEIETLFVECGESFKYEIKSIKKAF